MAFHHSSHHCCLLVTEQGEMHSLPFAFLTTRIKYPDEHDCCQLTRLLQYLNRINYLNLIITTNSFRTTQKYVNTLYVPDEDCLLGRRTVTSFSRKQKTIHNVQQCIIYYDNERVPNLRAEGTYSAPQWMKHNIFFSFFIMIESIRAMWRYSIHQQNECIRCNCQA